MKDFMENLLEQTAFGDPGFKVVFVEEAIFWD
jgi:hypothetical protein